MTDESEQKAQESSLKSEQSATPDTESVKGNTQDQEVTKESGEEMNERKENDSETKDTVPDKVVSGDGNKIEEIQQAESEKDKTGGAEMDKTKDEVTNGKLNDEKMNETGQDNAESGVSPNGDDISANKVEPESKETETVKAENENSKTGSDKDTAEDCQASAQTTEEAVKNGGTESNNGTNQVVGTENEMSENTPKKEVDEVKEVESSKGDEDVPQVMEDSTKKPSEEDKDSVKPEQGNVNEESQIKEVNGGDKLNEGVTSENKDELESKEDQEKPNKNLDKETEESQEVASKEGEQSIEQSKSAEESTEISRDQQSQHIVAVSPVSDVSNVAEEKGVPVPLDTPDGHVPEDGTPRTEGGSESMVKEEVKEESVKKSEAEELGDEKDEVLTKVDDSKEDTEENSKNNITNKEPESVVETGEQQSGSDQEKGSEVPNKETTPEVTIHKEIVNDNQTEADNSASTTATDSTVIQVPEGPPEAAHTDQSENGQSADQLTVEDGSSSKDRRSPEIGASSTQVSTSSLSEGINVPVETRPRGVSTGTVYRVQADYLTRQVIEKQEKEVYLEEKLSETTRDLETAERKVKDLQLRLKRFVKDDEVKDTRMRQMEKEYRDLSEQMQKIEDSLDAKNRNNNNIGEVPRESVSKKQEKVKNNSRICVIL